MAVIVVGGAARGSGKTALTCGLIRALPEIAWTAVKVTSHSHGVPAPIWEETVAGQNSDTARYLAAGAKRALLVTVEDGELDAVVRRILKECGSSAGVIFESNRVLRCVTPDLCFAAESRPNEERKPSFDLVEQRMDARVERAAHDHAIDGGRMCFHLVSLDRISAPMIAWLRERLEKTAG